MRACSPARWRRGWERTHDGGLRLLVDLLSRLEFGSLATGAVSELPDLLKGQSNLEDALTLRSGHKDSYLT